jgi:hypothetical protein
VTAGVFNLTDQNAIEQGSDFSWSFIYNDVNGSPVNLTGYTLSGSIKKDWNTSTLASFTCSKHAPATDGYVGVSLSAAGSKTIPPSRYRYDILAANGTTTTHLLKGFVDVVESVTLP